MCLFLFFMLSPRHIRTVQYLFSSLTSHQIFIMNMAEKKRLHLNEPQQTHSQEWNGQLKIDNIISPTV